MNLPLSKENVVAFYSAHYSDSGRRQCTAFGKTEGITIQFPQQNSYVTICAKRIVVVVVVVVDM